MWEAEENPSEWNPKWAGVVDIGMAVSKTPNTLDPWGMAKTSLLVSVSIESVCRKCPLCLLAWVFTAPSAPLQRPPLPRLIEPASLFNYIKEPWFLFISSELSSLCVQLYARTLSPCLTIYNKHTELLGCSAPPPTESPIHLILALVSVYGFFFSLFPCPPSQVHPWNCVGFGK